MYIDYEYYKSMYGEKAMQEADFNRLLFDVSRKVDIETTGIDGVKKLQVAFPEDEYSAETVKRCICKLLEIASNIEKAEEAVRNTKGYITREDGTVTYKVVSSVSAGNESISFASGSTGATLIDKVLADKNAQEQLYKDTIREYLSGVEDANCINLLYMGKYPCY